MPEYKRFVAYFYEYINGKKEKNAGFVKVELRNGMWRILFRLTTELQPEEPVQVYGFVRENGYQLAIPFGLIRTGKPISEEWAYRADYTFETGKYSFADVRGIRIQSGDHRNFITVWDDEPMELDKFVLELPPEKEIPQTAASEQNSMTPEPQAKEIEVSATAVSEEENLNAENQIDQATADVGEKDTASEWTDISENADGGEIADDNETAANCCQELFETRQHFTPFSDEELQECVQIMPCDIVRLQQENWKVGRSSFLQHGFYQYRHLLFGKRADGTYMIGVPGIQNQTEDYMAKMCGFEHFKTARVYSCGKTFGYWWKTIEKDANKL